MVIELDDDFCAVEGTQVEDDFRIVYCKHCGAPVPIDEVNVSGYTSLGEGLYCCPKVACLQSAIKNVRDERDQWRREAMDY